MRNLGATVLITAAVALAVTGCQQRLLYQPRVGVDEPGYESWQESGSIYFVRFAGAPGMNNAQVRDLALLRAAELARIGGHAEFAVVGERAWKKSTFRRGAMAPPESPMASSPDFADLPPEQRDLRARARSLIGDGPPVRVELPFVELQLTSHIDAKLRAERPANIHTVADVLRDVAAKYDVDVESAR